MRPAWPVAWCRMTCEGERFTRSVITERRTQKRSVILLPAKRQTRLFDNSAAEGYNRDNEGAATSGWPFGFRITQNEKPSPARVIWSLSSRQEKKVNVGFSKFREGLAEFLFISKLILF